MEDDIEPMVPELPRDVRTDGGARRRTRRSLTFDNSEDDAPLVPDLS